VVKLNPQHSQSPSKREQPIIFFGKVTILAILDLTILFLDEFITLNPKINDLFDHFVIFFDIFHLVFNIRN
jgi:hypothetical protein